MCVCACVYVCVRADDAGEVHTTAATRFPAKATFPPSVLGYPLFTMRFQVAYTGGMAHRVADVAGEDLAEEADLGRA